MSYATLRGILYDTSRTPVVRANVSLEQKGAGGTITLASTTTSAAGQFLLDADLSDVTGTLNVVVKQGDRRLSVVTGESTFRAATLPDRLRLMVQTYEQPESFEVAPPVQALTPPANFSVRGHVLHPDGNPQAGVTVKPFKREVDGTYTQLTYNSSPAATTTDSEGAFFLGYNETTTRLGLEASDGSTILGRSSTTNPSANQILDVVIDDVETRRRASEYSRVVTKLTTSSTIDGKTWDSVGSDGIEMLADEHLLPKPAVRAFRDAQVLAADLSVGLDVAYGLIRNGARPDAYAATRTSAAKIQRTLEAAADANLVPSTVKDDAATHATTLRTDQITRTLAGEGVRPLGPSLDTTSLDGTEKTAFATALRDHSGPMETFWAGLSSVILDSGKRTEARKAFEALVLTKDDSAVMLQAIDDELSSPTIRDIAALTETQWTAVLANSTHSPSRPPEFSDDASYIDHLRREGEKLYPSAVVRQRILDGSPSSDLSTFLTNNPEHDFKARVTDTTVTGTWNDEDQLKADLKEYQRLFRVGPKFERHAAIEQMKTEGYPSAWSIARAGKTKFKNDMGSSGVSDEVLEEVAQKASSIAATNTLVLLQVAEGKTGTALAPNPAPEDISTDPDFTTLFDGLHYCDCKHCRSLLSPAAYLVDLLSWLEGRGVYDELVTSRRPDIPKILLSCENTNTPLPYIDLSLEILENAVSERPGFPDAHDTGDASAAQLDANPQYVNADAYAAIRTAVFPRKAPFDYFIELGTIFLGHVGVARPDLMTAFQTDTGTVQTPTAEEIAAARLGLGPTALDALTRTASFEDLWGMSSGFQTTLAADIKQLRDRAGLSRLQFADIQAVEFWNPGGTFTLADPDPGVDPCSIDDRTLENSPSAQDFGLLAQFLRGMDATGWTWLELDKTASAFGWQDFDDPAVAALADMVELQEALDLEPVELLALWYDLDIRADRPTAEHPVSPLYKRLLLDADASSNLYADDGGSYEPTTSTFALDGSELADTTPLLTDHVSDLQAAFGVDEASILAAIADVGTGLNLRLSTLSAVYRRTSLAKALGISVQQLLALRGLEDRLAPARWLTYRGSSTVADLNTGLSPAPQQGDAVVIGSSGGGTLTGSDTVAEGDIVSFDGTLWKLSISAASSVPPDGTRLVVATAGLLSPLTGSQDEGKIADFDGASLTPTLTTPTNGDLLLVTGDGLPDNGSHYEFSGSVPTGTWDAAGATLDAFSNPASALAFTKQLRELQDLDIALDEVLYLSGSSTEGSAAVAPTEDWMIAEIGGIRDGLLETLEPTQFEKHDPDGDFLRELLVAMGKETPSEQSLLFDQLVATSSPLSSTSINGVSTPDYFDEDHFDRVARAAWDASSESGSGTTAAARFAKLGGLIRASQARVRARSNAAELVATTCNLDVRTVEYAQTRTLTALPANVTLLDPFVDPALFETAESGNWGAIDRATFPDAFTALELAYKLGRHADAFNASHEDIEYWFADTGRTAPMGLVDLDALHAGAGIRAHQWANTVALFRFRDRLPGDFPTTAVLLQNLVGLSDVADFLTPLEERTGWDATELAQLLSDANIDGLSLDAQDLNRLADWHEIAGACGTTPSVAQGWRYADLYDGGTDRSAEIVGSIRGNYATQDAWFKVAKSLRDGLRARQQSALVAYLVANDSTLEDAADLHDKYLIDPEMSPCMPTSRIKHALGSVQLFIQRGMLGLEAPAVEFAPEDREEWTWRKNYRVWEAARKVFLYPENWVEPELRQDKTPAFEAFETALGSQEATAAHVEESLLAYLRELRLVSKLQILCVHVEDALVETEDGRTLHLIGRSRGANRRAFHRIRTASGIWKNWEEIPLKTKSEHVVALVASGRLRIFWADFNEVQDATGITVTRLTSISWMERLEDGWSEPQSEVVEVDLEDDPTWYRLGTNDPTENEIILSLHWAKFPDESHIIRVHYDIGADAVVLLVPRFTPTPVVTFDDQFKLAQRIRPVENAGFIDGVDLPSDPYTWQDALASAKPRLIVANLDHIQVDDTTDYFLKGWPLVVDSNPRCDLCTWNSETQLYEFENLRHPFVDKMIGTVRVEGVPGLLAPASGSDLDRQALTDPDHFEDSYLAYESIVAAAPVDAFDFEETRAFGIYNWEVFFHAPLMVAKQLSQNQQFEEAFRWFHYIFDPTAQDTTGLTDEQRPWRVKPFLAPLPADVTNWAAFTGATGPNAEAAAKEFKAQVNAWLESPFDPHVVARLRNGSYQRAVIKAYLDNLIAWGDQLFGLDTIESLNEATQLYLLALHILGERPEPDPQLGDAPIPAQSYDQLQVRLTGLDNPMVDLETLLPDAETVVGTDVVVPIDMGSLFYFCVPGNDQLLSYWDTIADRLFKIRNCLDIEGRARTLALFQPPIDPAALVRAAANGVSIGDVLNDLYAARPIYRYSTMSQRAQALVGSLRGLGSALLQALEKRDAEEVARLRSTLEISLSDQVELLREKQVESARIGLSTAKASKAEAQARHDYYDRLITKGLTGAEEKQKDKLKSAKDWQLGASATQTTASIVRIVIPTFEGTPAPKVGGEIIGASLMAAGIALSSKSSIDSFKASNAGINAGHRRRKQEWRHQRRQAKLQMANIDHQIASAELAVELAEHELKNHRTQLANLRATDALMRSKFTNQELYNWMVTEISKIYFQTYELAHSFAKKAQRCYEHELGVDASFVKPGHWDSLRKGLLAAERLQQQLEAMDAGYLENDIRERELVKHFSLSRIDPLALTYLREDGACFFELAEVLYDLDVPGQYFRRIKGVSLTIPGVTGPYATLNARLTLHQTWRRDEPTAGAIPGETGPLESIVTSGRPDDTGLFQFDFGDPRYLPFERRGAVSLWGLELTGFQHATYDPRSIDDVIMTVRYTARDGGSSYAGAVTDAILGTASSMEARSSYDTSTTAGSQTLPAIGFSTKGAFPDAWYALMNPAAPADAVLSVPLTEDHFPREHRGHVEITGAEVYLIVAGEPTYTLAAADIVTATGNTLVGTTDAGTVTTIGDAPVDGWSIPFAGSPSPDTLKITLDTSTTPTLDAALRDGTDTHKLNGAVVEDLFIVVRYTLSDLS